MHGSVVFQEKWWLLGGNHDGYPDEFNDVWSTEDGTNWVQVTEHAAWTPRCGAGTAVFGGKMWIMGGSFSMTDVWSSEDGLNWSEVTPVAPWSGREFFSAVVFRDRLWVLSDLFSNDIWNTADGENWDLVTADAPWAPRSSYSAVVFQDSLWVLGGSYFDYICYDYDCSDVWCTKDGVNWTRVTEFAPWGVRRGHATAVFDNKLWLFGGEYLHNPCGRPWPEYLDDVWCTEDGAVWQQLDDAPWYARSFHTATVLKDKLWILGGRPGRDDAWPLNRAGGEGEGEGEGEGCGGACHSADRDGDGRISLSELLGMIQLYFYGDYHCDPAGEGGFSPGPGDQTCAPHDADFAPQDWFVSLGELLRIVQFFNGSGYHACAEGEDGFCPGAR